MYRLLIVGPAQKDLDRLEGDAWRRVRDALQALRADPRPHGVTKLKGSGDAYRIRIGDYRAIYDLDDDAQTVTILRVKHRRELYRDL